MRRPRLKAPENFTTAIYHCVSRVVDRQKVLKDVEKEQFVRFMRMYERLFGLRIITFCIMGNHFHILVEVPQRPTVMPTDDELVALVKESKGKEEAATLGQWLKHWRSGGQDSTAEEFRERYFRQMWDVSQFMKVLKQRFSQWFNGSRPKRRKGTLWEDRFRSVLVQDGVALRAMAAYIDLNPIRAKLVADPADYRWSGYGEASAGVSRAIAGLQRVEAGLRLEGLDIGAEILPWYRVQLFGHGKERTNEQGVVVKKGFNPEQVAEVEAAKGATSLPRYLRNRVRYFTDGAAIGSKAFIEEIFQEKRGNFSEKRATGARRLKGLEKANPLRTLRALVRDAVGGPT